MTVAELVEVLRRYPPDTRVQVTWETTVHEIDEDAVYLTPYDGLLIDADGNAYKEWFLKGGRR